MNDSSTTDVICLSRSSDNLVTSPRNAAALIACLSTAYKGEAQFPILSSRKIDRQKSPELWEVKQIVKTIAGSEFQTISEVGINCNDCRSTITEYKSKLFNNRAFIEIQEPDIQTREVEKIRSCIANEKDKFGTRGEQSIRRHSELITKFTRQTRDAADRVQLKIQGIRKLRDNTEYWQGFWDSVRDYLLPDASVAAGIPEPIAAVVVWVSGLVAHTIVYDRAWGREKFKEALQTWEEMLNRDHEMILKTRIDLGHYINFITKALGLWLGAVQKIFPLKIHQDSSAIVQYGEYSKDFDEAEKIISLTIKPIGRALEDMNPFFGLGISVERNAKEFCEDVPEAFNYLRKLLTAKGIICSSKQEEFHENVYCLAELIYGQLQHIDELCAPFSNSIDPGKLDTFIRTETVAFKDETGRVMDAIKLILNNEVCTRKKAYALKKRTKYDRLQTNWDWNDRPLVTSAGALEVLEDLEAIIKVIHSLSVSIGTGTNMSPIEGIVAARRSYVEFNRENSSLQKFFNVLMEEVERGSSAVPTIEKRKTGMNSRFRGFRRFIPGLRPKTEAPLSGL